MTAGASVGHPDAGPLMYSYRMNDWRRLEHID